MSADACCMMRMLGISAVTDLFNRHSYVCLFNNSTIAVINDFFLLDVMFITKI